MVCQNAIGLKLEHNLSTDHCGPWGICIQTCYNGHWANVCCPHARQCALESLKDRLKSDLDCGVVPRPLHETVHVPQTIERCIREIQNRASWVLSFNDWHDIENGSTRGKFGGRMWHDQSYGHIRDSFHHILWCRRRFPLLIVELR